MQYIQQLTVFFWRLIFANPTSVTCREYTFVFNTYDFLTISGVVVEIMDCKFMPLAFYKKHMQHHSCYLTTQLHCVLIAQDHGDSHPEFTMYFSCGKSSNSHRSKCWNCKSWIRLKLCIYFLVWHKLEEMYEYVKISSSDVLHVNWRKKQRVLC